MMERIQRAKKIAADKQAPQPAPAATTQEQKVEVDPSLEGIVGYTPRIITPAATNGSGIITYEQSRLEYQSIFPELKKFENSFPINGWMAEVAKAIGYDRLHVPLREAMKEGILSMGFTDPVDGSPLYKKTSDVPEEAVDVIYEPTVKLMASEHYQSAVWLSGLMDRGAAKVAKVGLGIVAFSFRNPDIQAKRFNEIAKGGTGIMTLAFMRNLYEIQSVHASGEGIFSRLGELATDPHAYGTMIHLVTMGHAVPYMADAVSMGTFHPYTEATAGAADQVGAAVKSGPELALKDGTPVKKKDFEEAAREAVKAAAEPSNELAHGLYSQMTTKGSQLLTTLEDYCSAAPSAAADQLKKFVREEYSMARHITAGLIRGAWCFTWDVPRTTAGVVHTIGREAARNVLQQEQYNMRVQQYGAKK